MYQTKTTNILVICSLDQSLINFRGDMLQTLLDNGYKVFAAAPNFKIDAFTELMNMGITPIEYKLVRTGLNPWQDVKSILAIRKIVLDNSINLIFPYTIKPVLYGSIAGRITSISTISLITGLGFTFSKSSKKAQYLQRLTEALYRLALPKNKAVIFQNSDDLELFRKKKLISKKQKAYIVDGSGINLQNYPYRINQNNSERKVFVLVARLIKEKGVELFLEAAKVLKNEFPKAEFHLIGEPEPSASPIKAEQLKNLHNHNIIVYHGFQKNISQHLAASDVFVLPTYYREGIPRSILEALSIGMPIITTNTPGCRETVDNEQNGLLIAPQNLDALISAIRYFLENPETIRPMGIYSRKLAEGRFNVEIINEQILDIIKTTILENP